MSKKIRNKFLIFAPIFKHQQHDKQRASYSKIIHSVRP